MILESFDVLKYYLIEGSFYNVFSSFKNTYLSHTRSKLDETGAIGIMEMSPMLQNWFEEI